MRGLVLAAALFSALTALAQGFDGQRFEPAAGAAGGLVLERPVVPPHLGFGVGLFFHFAEDPVVERDRATREVLSRPLDEALTADLLASIGLFNLAELAVDLPVHLVYSGDELALGTERIRAARGIGDLRLVPKAILLRGPDGTVRYSLGLAAPITLPTGNAAALRGNESFTAEPKLLFGLFGDRWGASFNAGFRARPSGPSAPVGHEITFAAGGAYSVWPDRDFLDLLVEVVGAKQLGAGRPGAGSWPLELLAGAVVKPIPSLHLYGGGGVGLTSGLGTPDFRALIGVRFAPFTPSGAFKDADRDGVADVHDRCPEGQEDLDAFEDGDGCPEEDNDRDAVPDEIDECPDIPEEPGGDGDGCPDDPRIVIESGRINIVGKIQFEIGSAALLPKSEKLIGQLAQVLNEHKDIERIRIEGHTDSAGEEATNRRLSQQRAETVRQALIRQGVDASRLSAQGFGESKPIAPNDTPAGRAKNRRVELTVMD